MRKYLETVQDMLRLMLLTEQ